MALFVVGLEWFASLFGAGAWFGGNLLVKRPFWVIAPFMFIGFSVQFFVMGLNAELNARTWFESQRKPVYTIRETAESDR